MHQYWIVEESAVNLQGGGEQYDSVYLYNDATKKFELIFEGYALKVELYVWMFLSTVE